MSIQDSYTLRVLLVLFLAFTGCQSPDSESESTPEQAIPDGPFLGQTPPGMEPQLFAPGIVSTGKYERDVAMTPDGSEFYFGLITGGFTTIVGTRRIGDRWTEPEVPAFASNPQFFDLEPHISPDGQRFFFLSSRPPAGKEASPGWVHQNIWVVDREGDGWGEPYDLGPPINTDDNEYFPSATKDGTLYFSRSVPGDGTSYIFRSRRVEGEFTEPEKLPPEVNSVAMQANAFIAPDESFLIVCVMGREDNIGPVDYYISFRDASDSWVRPINMGEAFNSADSRASSAYLSPDGRYLFFASSRRTEEWAGLSSLTHRDLVQAHQRPGNGSSDIYWVDVSILRELRP